MWKLFPCWHWQRILWLYHSVSGTDIRLQHSDIDEHNFYFYFIFDWCSNRQTGRKNKEKKNRQAGRRTAVPVIVRIVHRADWQTNRQRQKAQQWPTMLLCLAQTSLSLLVQYIKRQKDIQTEAKSIAKTHNTLAAGRNILGFVQAVQWHTHTHTG